MKSAINQRFGATPGKSASHSDQPELSAEDIDGSIGLIDDLQRRASDHIHNFTDEVSDLGCGRIDRSCPCRPPGIGPLSPQRNFLETQKPSFRKPSASEGHPVPITRWAGTCLA